MIHKLQQTATRLLDTSYVGRFLLRMIVFYLVFRSINWLWVGLVTPEGYYSSFIDQYLDYVNVVKFSILKVGTLFSSVVGVPAIFINDSLVQVSNGGQIEMAWACCGLEIMSFWAAFVLADTTSKSVKLWWGLGGLFCLWFINCCRIMLLLLAKEYRWEQLLNLDQHFLFNVVAYSFVFMLMYVYYRKNKYALGS
ncbi:MAG: exosortase/archaeosortase family protein [Chitinophagaceae bacterium]|nr:MAG: exosortase/archaeosortase family protein [Chitinophagaceae bacterium]